MKLALTILLIIAVLGGGIFMLIPRVENPSPQQSAQNPAEQTVQNMTTDQKIGQLIIGGFQGATMSDELERLIAMYSLGGFNLLTKNTQDAVQTQKLTQTIQEAYSARGLPRAFIAADQEGGAVVRFPYLKELTAQYEIDNAQEAKAVAKRRALELKELGVNMIFAPVLDYVSDPKAYLYPRTFHATADQVSKLGGAMIEGYRAGGIIAAPKHFPGYGNTLLDPHKNRVLLSKNQEEFDASINIFKTVITASRPEAMMTSHAIIPFVDSSPATLSLKVIADLLRGKLEYHGIIITDDLDMASGRQNRTLADTAIEALIAGNDMLIITSSSSKNIPAVLGAIKNAVREGIISEEKLNEKALKIISLKRKYLY